MSSLVSRLRMNLAATELAAFVIQAEMLDQEAIFEYGRFTSSLEGIEATRRGSALLGVEITEEHVRAIGELSQITCFYLTEISKVLPRLPTMKPPRAEPEKV